ncbi:AAA family ATPase [Streptomyces sp. NPDC056191]|uniref:AAA family ATPase n=1 Tax=Streptomyces sp. NPDC056191 TaxID=3345742 RepID=UPI0035DBE2FF
MRLHTLTLNGYKRFKAPTEIHLDEPVIALVGPNEAGKTSILQALMELNSDEALERSNHSRGGQIRGIDPISAKYLLEEKDLQLVADLPLSVQPKWLTVSKSWIGQRTATLTPSARWDNSHLKKVNAMLSKVISDLPENYAVGDAAALDSLRRGSSFLRRLESVDEKSRVDVMGGGKEFIGVIDDLLRFLDGVFSVNDKRSSVTTEFQDTVLTAQIELHDLVKYAREPSLEAEATRRLLSSAPRYLPFTEESRDVPASLNIAVETPDIPLGLRNLLGIAGLSLPSLQRALKLEDWAQLEFTLSAANERLSDVMESWSQEQVSVRFRVDHGILRIFFSSSGKSAFTEISERSDGLRSYVALMGSLHAKSDLGVERPSGRSQEVGERGVSRQAKRPSVTARKNARPVILLVDEAENHLHYDAQADLVNVFTSQKLAQQVIYSTHSAGCLPEDLGAGVRVVSPIPKSEQSEVRNWFWQSGAGFSPILLGMGATSLAFSSVRSVIIAEGATELILLPTLIREAIQSKKVGFQVAPGLSEVHPRMIGELDSEGARVCYLVDGDKGGDDLRKKLEGAGIQGSRIFSVSGSFDGKVTEDLLDEQVYRRVINRLLTSSHGASAAIPDTRQLGDVNRPGLVNAWCKEIDVPSPSKRTVAQELVREARISSVLSVEGGVLVRELHEKVLEGLKA